jgi:hypothetical protein
LPPLITRGYTPLKKQLGSPPPPKKNNSWSEPKGPKKKHQQCEPCHMSWCVAKNPSNVSWLEFKQNHYPRDVSHLLYLANNSRNNGVISVIHATWMGQPVVASYISI